MSSRTGKLRKDIEALHKKASSERYYVNPKELKELCTLEVIKGAVEECGFSLANRTETTHSILKTGIIIFSILVQISEERLMIKFLDREELDEKLPMNIMTLEKIIDEAANKFYKVQWEFTPVILPKRRHRQIDDEVVLPFMHEKHLKDRDGSFGTIYRFTMESNMQRFFDTEKDTVTVIRKQIQFDAKNESFARERECLKLLQRLNHPNIVDLLGSYTYKGEHSLLFECQDMDLNDFLKCEDRHKDFRSNTTFFTALYGLISAIEFVHNCELVDDAGNITITGYHHDIRPNNILIRSNTFLLADFGLSKMDDEDKLSTSLKAFGGDYIAPECLAKKPRLGRPADIWSLGGIMVDIAAYIENGPRGRIEAQNRRMEIGPYAGLKTAHFFSDDCLKSGVLSCIHDLQVDPADKTVRSLLILSRHMLKVPPAERPDAHNVRENAAYIAIKSLFRTALTSMIGWRKRSRESRPNRTWEDTWKLWAWGEEIGINGARLMTSKYKNAIAHAEKTEAALQRILTDLVTLLASEQLSEYAKDESRGIVSSDQYYSKESDKINNCIRSLKSSLPDAYGRGIEKWKSHYGREADKDSPGLPKLSDEALQSTIQLNSPSSASHSLLDSPRNHRENQSIKSPLKVSNKPDEHRETSKKRKNKAQSGEPPPLGRPLSISGKETDNIPGKDEPVQKSASKTSLSKTGDPFMAKNHKPTTPGFEVDDPAASSSHASSVFSYKSNYTDPTPPGLADYTKPATSSSTNGKASPSQLPKLVLPEPILGTGISAELTFKPTGGRFRHISCEIHLQEGIKSSSESKSKYILCVGKDGDGSIRHIFSRLASKYPHTDQSVSDVHSRPTVYFLGTQRLCELELESALNQEHPIPHDSANAEETIVDTSNVKYSFNSQKDYKKFREDVWDNELVTCTGTERISIPAVETTSEVLTLWKSRSDLGTLTVVFRARKKNDEWQHIDLQLDTSEHEGRVKADDVTLLLNIVASSEESSVKSNKGRTAGTSRHLSKEKRDVLKIKFRSEDDCAAFRAALRSALRPASQPAS